MQQLVKCLIFLCNNKDGRCCLPLERTDVFVAGGGLTADNTGAALGSHHKNGVLVPLNKRFIKKERYENKLPLPTESHTKKIIR